MDPEHLAAAVGVDAGGDHGNPNDAADLIVLHRQRIAVDDVYRPTAGEAARGDLLVGVLGRPTDGPGR